ncbi:MAG: DUF3854 domain-containing protein [Oscillospiraceae bacterium]|nr:DUF3854 domain-containing protein [Oscillospiraceae bacterium]
METYRISDVVGLLGLPPAPNGKASYYIPCPCCDHGKKERHLNINLQKDVFRCPRCGISGGIFDLYSLFTNTPRDSVRAILAERLGGGETRRSAPSIPEAQECPLTDINTRHETYTALLKLLSLAPDHRDNLLSRGLTDDEITAYGYKSTPVVGLTALAKQLQNEGHYLAGVPGFFRTKDGNWTFICESRGILIPARDMNGRVQGLQIRRDSSVKGKFRWISSVGKDDGCPSECWTHLRGPVSPSLILTEGPMKADIIYSLSGLTTLAVPGVNSLNHLEESLLSMKDRGLCEIYTAFDMDYMANYHVQQGYANLYGILDRVGLPYGTYLWDPRYKGLDDYIWLSLMQSHRNL